MTLAAAAHRVLAAAEPNQKVGLTANAVTAWRAGGLLVGSAPTLDEPARPLRPALLPPGKVPRRKINRGIKGRVALLHAVAHIELNAIDLAWDLVARFTAEDLPQQFYDDWVTVAAEEAQHYAMVSERLGELGAAYGDLPAHNGLWESAQDTQHDLAARLAVVPLVLEARGLDVTPDMVDKLRAVEDHRSADILEVIYREEIGHVAAGHRWFGYVCRQRGVSLVPTWQALVARHFRGQLKEPFNEPARRVAGFDPASYLHGYR